MPEVAAATPADDLRADHEVAAILAQLDRLGDGGLGELGQPVPDSNFALEENSSLPQAAHRYRPSSWLWTYVPVNGGSVPWRRRISYCSGVSSWRHCSSVFWTVSVSLLMRLLGVSLLDYSVTADDSTFQPPPAGSGTFGAGRSPKRSRQAATRCRSCQ